MCGNFQILEAISNSCIMIKKNTLVWTTDVWKVPICGCRFGFPECKFVAFK